MIISIEGKLGCGKTGILAMLVHELREKTGKPVYSNVNFTFPYNKLEDNKFLKQYRNGVLQDCIIALDQHYVWYDSRQTQSRENKLFSYLASQANARNIDIFMTTTHVSDFDIRIRRLVDVRIYCKYSKDANLYKMRVMDLSNGERYYSSFSGEDIHKLFEYDYLVRTPRTDIKMLVDMCDMKQETESVEEDKNV